MNRITDERRTTYSALFLFVVVALLMWAGWVQHNDRILHNAATCADAHAEPGTPEWAEAFSLCLESPVTP